MEQFQISRKPLKNKIYKKLVEYFTKKVKETESLTIDPVSVKLPTAHCLIIRFSVPNKGEKYELTIQGDWRTWYAELANNPDLEKPTELNIEMVIRARYKDAYKIN